MGGEETLNMLIFSPAGEQTKTERKNLSLSNFFDVLFYAEIEKLRLGINKFHKDWQKIGEFVNRTAPDCQAFFAQHPSMFASVEGKEDPEELLQRMMDAKFTKEDVKVENSCC